MFARSKQGAVDVIAGDGPIKVEFIESLSELFEECLAEGQPRVVMNLENVPLIDSSGLELLLDIQENYQQRGGALKLAAANPLCQEILELTEVNQHVELYPDPSSAVSSFV